MDTLSPKQRSERMARIRSKHTKPELAVRVLLASMGFRYRLHCAKLPGIPDIVFPGRKRAIFVHGCFWHQHRGCKISHLPKSKEEFWRPKLSKNRKRDALTMKRLRVLGWKGIVIWECQTARIDKLKYRLERFLAAQATTGRRDAHVHIH